MEGSKKRSEDLKDRERFRAEARPVLVHGGPIHTLDGSNPQPEALVIEAGRVAAAGDKGEMRARAGVEALELDLEGYVAMPGLVDTHPHLLHYGTLEEPLVDIVDAESHDDIAARIRRKAAATPAGEWIMTTPVGHRHYKALGSYKDLPEGRLPDRTALDRATTDHPVVICAWPPMLPNSMALNSMALERLGIGPDTPDRMHNVWIEKDAEGNPTGVLTGSVNHFYCEDPFNFEIWQKIPYLQNDLARRGTQRAMRDYHALGVTSIYENHMMDPPQIEIYRQLHEDDQLTVRVLCTSESESYGMPWSRPRTEEKFRARLEWAAQNVRVDDDFFRLNGVSLPWDGICSPGYMRMKHTYKGPYGEPTEGLRFITEERAERVIKFCAERRLRLVICAMGNGAQEETLEQLERISKDHDVASLHWTLMHAFFVEPEQVKRYSRLGFDVTTTMTVLSKGETYVERMGEEVLQYFIPLRNFFDSGIHVSGGSDWGPKNGFKQMELALTHRFLDSDRSNLGPAQRCSREEAIAMWTTGAARVMQWEDIGSLAVGNHGDLIVIDKDPFTCAVEKLGETRVLRTLLAGRTIYEA